VETTVTPMTLVTEGDALVARLGDALIQDDIRTVVSLLDEAARWCERAATIRGAPRAPRDSAFAVALGHLGARALRAREAAGRGRRFLTALRGGHRAGAGSAYGADARARTQSEGALLVSRNA